MDVFTTSSNETPKAVRQITETYESCYAAKLANETICNEIIRGDMKWTGPSDADINREYWGYFIKKLILHLNLFGYAVYRYNPKKGEPVEIAPPEAQTFVFDKNQWHLKSTSTPSGKRLRGTRNWKATIMNAPERSEATDTMVFTSAGWRSLSDSDMIVYLEDNIRKRDAYNSAPMVYTEISPSIAATSTQRPWFSRPGGDNGALPIVPRDFNTVVEERAETIARLDELTDETRQRARDKYIGNYQLGTGSAPEEEYKEHKELIVSDGRKAAPVPYLRAPEDCIRLLTKYEHRILFAYGVPPQTVGENINSERNAASSRLADVSLDLFQSTCDKIRDHINKALKDMSIFFSRNKDVYLKIYPCISKFKLAKLEGILTESACRRYYACAYNVREEDIDPDALRLRQNTINAQQGTKDRVENTVPTKNRPAMTVEQKSFRDAEKGMMPTE